MAEALYRKYRPQKFSDVAGQVGIVQTLTQQISQGKISHAYLFAGTRGTGKTTLARIFAKAANCEQRAANQSEPCTTCQSCLDITTGRSIDVIELDAATHTGVDNVREEIIENARFLPTRSKFKIFIIDEVHMLSTSSFNALLKSLEEPPAHVIYILATTELHKIPATIISRCQRFIFRPLPQELMQERLLRIAAAENVTLSGGVVARVLAASGGAMRDAESLLGQLLVLNSQNINEAEADLVLPPTLFSETINFLKTLQEKGPAGAIQQLESLFTAGVDLVYFHDSLIKRAHEALVVATTGDAPTSLGVFSDSERQALKSIAQPNTAASYGRLLELLVAKKPLYKNIASPLIPLYLVVMGWQENKNESNQNAPAPIRPAPINPITNFTPPKPIASTSSAPISATSPTPSNHPDLILEDVQARWQDCVTAITNEMPSLGAIFSSATVAAVSGRDLSLVVQFQLHRDKLLDSRVRRRLETILGDNLGGPIRCLVENALVEKNPEAAVTDILNTFGGKIVA